MSRLVDQLLVLAQLDAQAAAPVSATSVDLAEIATEIVSQYAPLAVADDKSVALELNDDVLVKGRREAIGAALRNLVENGLRVTPSSGTVTVTAGPGARLSVSEEWAKTRISSDRSGRVSIHPPCAAMMRETIANPRRRA